MADMFLRALSNPAALRVLIVGPLVALCAALLGVSLVLKRYSMIGDGLSHVGFGALAIAVVMNAAPMAVAIPVVVIAAFLLLRISENTTIKGDAAIALISAGALAIGQFAVSVFGVGINIEQYMFGYFFALSQSDAVITLILAPIVLIVFILFYNRIFAVTFDETFARATGVRADAYGALIAVLTAVVIVLGMRIMGTLLISSLIIFPPLSSMRVFKTFRAVVISSAIVSVVCFGAGFCASLYDAPIGASIVIANMTAFGVFWIVGKLKKASK